MFNFYSPFYYCSISLICYAFRRTYFFSRKKSKQKMLHRKELTRSPIEHLFVFCKFVDGLLARQLFDSLVFVFVPAGTIVLKFVV